MIGVTWQSAAFDAGLTVGTKILSVGGEAYTPERMRAAITAAKGTKTPIALIVKDGDAYRDVGLDYHDGLRYPRLEKTGTGETGLDRLLAPR